MAETRIGKPAELLRKSGPVAAKPAASPPGGGPPKKGPDGRLRLTPGEQLFLQGDPGGDLFFIEEGIVEIYQEKEGETIILAEMTVGEIIGVMTCMTSEARMASARAKTVVICKKVPHDSIKKVLSVLPNWMKIVIKEFTIRLTQMNKVYSDAVLQIRRLEANQISHVYLGSLIASAFGQIAEYMAISYEGTKIALVEDVLQKLEFVLNLTKDDIDRVFNVLLEAGLVRQEIEPEKKRLIVKIENAQKLAYFSQFVRESKHGPTKKFLRARFSHKETRVLSAIVKYAARLGMDLDKTGKLPVADLEKSLERSTGVRFEREALDKGISLKLLAVEGEEENQMVVVKPTTLGRTVACVEAIRKLTALDQKGGAKGGEGEDQEAA